MVYCEFLKNARRLKSYDLRVTKQKFGRDKFVKSISNTLTSSVHSSNQRKCPLQQLELHLAICQLLTGCKIQKAR